MSPGAWPADPIRARRSALGRAAKRAVEQSGLLLLVDGLPGMGKSTLLRELAGLMETQHGWSVVYAHADRFERGEPYSFMERLFAGDLASGWTFEAEPAQHPIPIARECLHRILEDEPEDGRLIVVDDAQWIDDASARVLRYLVPRLTRRRVMLAFGTRTPHERGSFGEFLNELSGNPDGEAIHIHPLRESEIRALAVERFGVGIAKRNAEALRNVTGGSFLHVDTILSQLTPEEIAKLHLTWDIPIRGARPLDNPLLVEYEELGPEARATVEIVCVAGSEISRTTLEAAAARLDEPVRLDEAFERQVLRESGFGSLVVPHHALMAHAVRRAIGTERSRRISGALAETLTGFPAVKHALAGADAWRPELRERVIDYVESAIEQGASANADEVLRGALAMAADRESREELLIELAVVHLRAKTVFHLVDLFGEYEQLPEGALREYILILISAHRVDIPFPHERVARLLATPGEDPDERTLQASLAFMAVIMTMRSSDPSAVVRLIPQARHFFEQAPEDPAELRDRRLAWLVAPREHLVLLDCYAMVHTHRQFDMAAAERAVRELIGRAQALPDGGIKADVLIAIAGALAAFGRFEAAAQMSGQAVRIVDAGHHPWGAGTVRLVYAHCLVMLGEYEEAGALLSLMEEVSYDVLDVETRPLATALRAFVAAGTGREDPAPLVAQARRRHEIEWESYAPDLAVIAACEAARADDDPEGVIAASEDPYLERITSTQHGFLTYRAQALIRLGRLDEAEALLDRLEKWRGARWQECWGSLAWLRALLAAARGDDAEAERRYEEAAAGDSPYPLPRAQMLADYGEFLAARGREDEARSRLGTAMTILRKCGAERYLPRVRSALAALRNRDRSERERLLAALTARELEIANRLIDGESNRQIAEALVVSQATVRFHVSNVLRKLQVSSRGAAARVLRVLAGSAARIRDGTRRG
ncbi:LuxR C-terminal-related transcriptional regulator, partial [Gulosibacter sp. 10]|uniref:LuxR C-terminal-related transcriptional regulator n=1 Tax=Gulosibacter sp. 10 TaxID=1255570 RepID=UPI00111EFE12